MSIDISFIILPKIDPSAPLVGPPLLAQLAQEEGYKVNIFDFNVILFHQKNYFGYSNWASFEVAFSYKDKFDLFVSQANELIDSWVEEVLHGDPKVVGLTAFTEKNDFFCEEFAKRIRTHPKGQNVILLMGGPQTRYIGPKLKKEALIDYYIVGEAELPILNLLQGKTSDVGLNGKALPYSNFKNNPMPAYKLMDLHMYKGEGRYFFVTGSRGCIQWCDFCEVRDLWGYFRVRNLNNLMSEIKCLHEDFNVELISFTDSVVNANMKYFRKLIRHLIDYNKLLEKPISYTLFIMVRDFKDMTEEDYKLLGEFKNVTFKVGIESGSDKIRQKMNKGFSEKDLNYFMQQIYKHKICIELLMMVGYPGETEMDFQKSKEFLYKYHHLTPDVVKNIRISPTFITEGVPLYKKSDELSISYDKSGHWIQEKNNFNLRVKRHFELQEYAESLSYPILKVQKDERDEVFKKWNN